MRVSDSGGVRTITFDRPDARNAFTGEVAKELADTIADTDIEKVDIVVLTGEGKAFSAGGDIKAMSQREESTHEAYERVRATLGRVFEEIWTAPFPVVAKVNGDAVGAGMSLAAVSDFAYASEGARFGSVFIKVGLIPDMGGSFLLPRIVGLRKAKELAFTGKLIAAEEAAEIGLVDRVLPSSELDKAVDEFAQELGSQPSETLKLTKQAFHENLGREWSQALDHEAHLQALAYDTRAHEEGVNAFIEGREPEFD